MPTKPKPNPAAISPNLHPPLRSSYRYLGRTVFLPLPQPLSPRFLQLAPSLPQCPSRRTLAMPPRSSFFDGLLGALSGRTGDSPPGGEFKRDEVDNDADAQHHDDGGDGKFMQLDYEGDRSVDGSSETPFGPLVVLAVGLLAREFRALRELLDDIGAEQVDLLSCLPEMLDGTCSLGEALSMKSSSSSSSEAFVASPLGTRRVIFLSGMYGAEVIDVVGAMRVSGIVGDAAFAAAVPKSWDRPLNEVVADVYEGACVLVCWFDRTVWR
jgi:hypothetical protein